MKLFKTFKPENPILQKFISYYYLDRCDDVEYFNEYTCYPHFNTTLSFYKSHTLEISENQRIVKFNEKMPYLKMLTQIREHPLKVTQIGKVHKVAVVFEPLGVNQFLENKKIKNLINGIFNSYNPIIDTCLKNIFNTKEESNISAILDTFFLNQLSEFKNEYLEKAIQLFHQADNLNTIEEIAEKDLGISRKHLNHLFVTYLNITPQKYRIIVRFRHLMTAKLNAEAEESLTNLAYFAKYSDQSHFIKACKQLTGLKPKDFFHSLETVGSEDIFWTFTK